MIEINQLTKRYGDEVALRGLATEFEEGDFITVYGVSGSGKTTLLNIIATFDSPDNGEILYGGANLTRMSESERRKFRRTELGYVFQSFRLIPFLTASENIRLSKTISNTESGWDVDTILQRVGLGGKADKKPPELSSGERQRVGIARALVKEPSLVLADEPTGNLDTETGSSIVDLMKEINRDTGATFILATHDPSIAEDADEVMEIVDGEMVERD